VTVIDSSSAASVLHMPAPRAALRHAVPMVFEGIVAPIAVFYLVLLVGGFRGALLAALGWSTAALVRRLVTGGRVSSVLILGVGLLAVRTAIAFITRSPTLYFVPPMAWSVVVSFVLIGSAAARRPFTQRFAHDFCPLDPALLRRPRVQQFFVRVSLLWAGVMLTNTGIVLWLFVTSSLKAFVLERTAITWGFTAGAIACSILGFTWTMRRDGIVVQWGESHAASAPLPGS
jgi:hypothetical protein